MSQTTKSHARIHALDERLARLRAERIRLAARVSHTERRRDTRRKILIGATVLAAVDHDGVPVLRSQSDLLQWLDDRLIRPHDRAVFDLRVVTLAGSPRRTRRARVHSRASRGVRTAHPPRAVRPYGRREPGGRRTLAFLRNGLRAPLAGWR